MLYADVIIDISHEALDRPFQYIVPKEMESAIFAGSVCHVPFGRGDNLKKAYVIGISKSPKIDTSKLKTIDSIEKKDVSIEGRLIALSFWMAKRYGATTASCLRSVLPVAKRAALADKKTVQLNVDSDTAGRFLVELTAKKRYSVAKERLINELIREKALPWDVITGKLNISSSTIRELEKKDVLKVINTKNHYVPRSTMAHTESTIKLNSDQQSALDIFASDWDAKIHNTYLLYGVTGSGKTEVYIRMIKKVVEEGRDAIVLIPEIALTYQTLMRFYHRFGDLVSVINSRLSSAERYDIYERAKKGEIKIIIGPRSALFTPFKNLGIIIVDEEHETSYKSEKMPRYHAREVAIELAKISEASVVLGSATPAIESFYEAKKGNYKLLSLPKRAGKATPSQTEIIDLRRELKEGNRSIISRRLAELIDRNLKEKKQTMLFLNRRGMLGSVSCRACGEVIKCPHCDVSLSLHRDKRLHCHYCGYVTEFLKSCPKCGSPYIGGFKAGTEKIQEEVQRLFPKARILRMDADSTKGKDGHEKILSVFSNKDADILIGTQMIVKGHDFSDVSLVGVLAADLSLNANDFRSSERTFNLITQAVGRAGRKEIAGNAVIQTYRPDHYAIIFACKQDYEAFFEKEIAYRSLLSYPPVGHILLVMILGRDEDKVVMAGKEIYEKLRDGISGIWMSEPVMPAISKIKDIHRRMIYFKAKSIEELIEVRSKIDEMDFGGVTIYFDTDPMSM